LQQALTDAGDDRLAGTALHDPAAVFGPGTPELHHIRRHSSYLAETAGQLLGLLGRLAGILTLSLLVLFGPAILLGITIRWLYRWLPFGPLPTQSQLVPEIEAGTLTALIAVATTAFLLTLFARRNSAH